jgi:hypothetical protein
MYGVTVHHLRPQRYFRREQLAYDVAQPRRHARGISIKRYAPA